jgi:hypothetical protein
VTEDEAMAELVRLCERYDALEFGTPELLCRIAALYSKVKP